MVFSQKIRNWLAVLLLIVSFCSVGIVATQGSVAFAAPKKVAPSTCGDRLLTFPAWYKGLLTADCDIESPTVKGISTFIWTIVFNVIEMMLQLVGYISVGYIITGGFRYITSAGAADGMVKARKTIVNAVVGLVISIFSVAIVNLVAGALQG